MPECEFDKMIKSVPPEKQRAYANAIAYAMSEANYGITGNAQEIKEKLGFSPDPEVNNDLQSR